MTNERNIHWHHGTVTRLDRERLNGHKGITLWLTGFSGSGKSTIARGLEEALFLRSCRTFVLDGDNIRFGLNKDLGFSRTDRDENIRRVGEVAKLFTAAGIITIVSFISPYRADRDRAREMQDSGDFAEVYVKCGIDECERRDPKGLYKKARAGALKDFTGIDDPYEEPLTPEFVIDTAAVSEGQAVAALTAYLESRGVIAAAKEHRS